MEKKDATVIQVLLIILILLSMIQVFGNDTIRFTMRSIQTRLDEGLLLTNYEPDVTNIVHNETYYNQTYYEIDNEEFYNSVLTQLEELSDRLNATITVNVECDCSGGSSRTSRTYNYHNETVNNNTTIINEGDDGKGRREIIMYKEIWVKDELKHVKYKHLK